MQKTYFPNIYGLRFIAAFLVVIHHIDLEHIDYLPTIPFAGFVGKLGVIFFYVLSGFLITHLLLSEQKITNNINFSKFYKNRALRIWPLYIFIVLISFIFFNQFLLFHPKYQSINLSENKIQILLYLSFLPNIASLFYGIIPFLSHTWTIGVEEQFYLIWPILIKKIKNKNVLLWSIIIGYLFTKYFLFNFLHSIWANSILIHNINIYFNYFNIDSMAIGGLFAYLNFNKNSFLSILENKIIQFLTIMLSITLIYNRIYIPYIHYQFFSFLFGIIILNASTSTKSILQLENQLLIFLGKISYGIYIFHPFAIVATIYLLDTYNKNKHWSIFYILTMLITVLLASLSYYLIEKPFLKLKS